MVRSEEKVKFIVDVMLGRLANYLLLLGYDCEYRRQFPDKQLLQLARKENRIIITRDAELAEQCSESKICYLKTTELLEQLKIVKNKFSLEFTVERLFTRCTGCNQQLVELDREEIEAEKIPPRTRSWLQRYFKCPACEKIYWRGTHYQQVKERLENWGLLDG